MHKAAFTVEEAVAYSGIGRTKLYQLFKAGAIVPRKAGKRTLILADDLNRLLRSLPVAA
jgi:excisionase family DNA binding protein